MKLKTLAFIVLICVLFVIDDVSAKRKQREKSLNPPKRIITTRSTRRLTTPRRISISHRSKPTHASTSSSSRKSTTDFLATERRGQTRPGQTNPPWSNPHLTNKPSAPSAPYPTPERYPPTPVHHPTLSNTQHPPYPNPHPTNTNHHPPYPNPHLPNTNPHPTYPNQHPTYPNQHPTYPNQHPTYPNQHPPYPNPHPSVPVSVPTPPPIGFINGQYPPTHYTPSGSQHSAPQKGNPPYPTYPMPSSRPTWMSPPAGTPYQTQTPPIHIGNPYSLHPPTYGAPGGYQGNPTPQTQILMHPAQGPIVPGSTNLVFPVQQDSGRGVGQILKEAVIFSTVNAVANRLINPHTYSVQSKPDSATTTTTHITYNNQYFNTSPGANGTGNPIGVPQGVPNYSNTEAGVFNGNYSSGGYPQSVAGGSGVAITPGSTNQYSPTSNGGSTVPINSSVGTAAPAVGSRTNENTPVSNPANADNSYYHYRISDEELYQISEQLFAKESQNMSRKIMLNLQYKINSDENITDKAGEPLFRVAPDVFTLPTVYATRSLYDRYEYDFRMKLNRSEETRKQENLLIDLFLDTHEMSTAMQWLADRGFIDPDDFERKDVLRRIWFTIFSGSSCGFERIFAAENYGSDIIGVQDWLYFESREALKKIDYMSYADKLNLGNVASILKLNYQMDGVVKQNATIFVGTPPELEMALYTICFFARTNYICPVSVGGTKFYIFTHSFTYFGIEIIDLAFPLF